MIYVSVSCFLRRVWPLVGDIRVHFISPRGGKYHVYEVGKTDFWVRDPEWESSEGLRIPSYFAMGEAKVSRLIFEKSLLGATITIITEDV